MTAIKLRALEPKDLDFLFKIENDMTLWHLSHTQQAFSADLLRRYIAEADRDIYEARQFRFGVEKVENQELIGFVDLFDFDPKNRRAGIGIVVANPGDRNKGVGAEALSLLCNYAFSVLDLHQLYANILEDNPSSIHLFEKMGFERIGVKKEWIRTSSGFKNEIMFQKINSDES